MKSDLTQKPIDTKYQHRFLVRVGTNGGQVIDGV